MKTLRRLLVAAGILALSAGIPVSAQISQDIQQVTVTAIIPVLMNLTIDTSTVTFNFDQNDYEADGTGTKDAVNATTLKVASNARWLLNVSADNAAFTFSPTSVGAPNPNKPCGDLSVSPDGTTYQALTITNTELARGVAGGNAVPANIIPVSYRLATTVANDPPGSYTLTLTYTLLPQ